MKHRKAKHFFELSSSLSPRKFRYNNEIVVDIKRTFQDIKSFENRQTQSKLQKMLNVFCI